MLKYFVFIIQKILYNINTDVIIYNIKIKIHIKCGYLKRGRGVKLSRFLVLITRMLFEQILFR